MRLTGYHKKIFREIEEAASRREIKRYMRFYPDNHWIYKAGILSHYCPDGNIKCLSCGEDRLICLTIDHINNDGGAHRKEIGVSYIYEWLRQNGYPPGFQVLCGNCNWKKRYADGLSESRFELRREVFSHYGGSHCISCGETDNECLVIDHVNGGGNQHLKKIGWDIYPFLKRNNYPSGFQVLCVNCNMTKQVQAHESSKRMRRNLCLV